MGLQARADLRILVRAALEDFFVQNLRLKYLLLLLSLGTLLLAGLAHADDESDFRRKPTAALAEKIARAAFQRDQYGKGMNWLERVPQAPGVTLEQLNWVAKMRAEMRWKLGDAGLGLVVLRVTPAKADVVIDGMLVPFHTAQHSLWLPVGGHSLEVISPDYATLTQAISARKGEKDTVVVALEATRAPELIVHVQPDADVWLNGQLQGPSTKIRFVVPSGSQLLELRAPGHQTWQQDLTLSPGDTRHINVTLRPNLPPPDPTLAHRAHQIDRPLLPSEIAEASERRKLDLKTGTPLDKGLGEKASADAATPEAQRRAKQRSAEQSEAAKPEVAKDSRAAEVNVPDRAEPTREVARRDDEAKRDVEMQVDMHDEAPSRGLSRSAKGWIFGGTGAVIAAGGVAVAYLGAQAAETANQLPRGSPDYTTDYASATQLTYIGYAAAGVGAVGMGVGTYYLFGDGGLSRSGKGWVVTTLGILTAGAGGWIAYSAIQSAKDTDATLAPKDPEYTRRFDLAARDRWIGIGVGGLGVALIGTGIALVASAPSSSAANDSAPDENSPGTEAPLLARLHFLPWTTAQATGGTLSLAW